MSAPVLLSDAEAQAAQQHFRRSKRKYAAFLSHHKDACATEARLVKEKLGAMLGVELFLGE